MLNFCSVYHTFVLDRFYCNVRGFIFLFCSLLSHSKTRDRKVELPSPTYGLPRSVLSLFVSQWGQCSQCSQCLIDVHQMRLITRHFDVVRSSMLATVLKNRQEQTRTDARCFQVTFLFPYLESNSWPNLSRGYPVTADHRGSWSYRSVTRRFRAL